MHAGQHDAALAKACGTRGRRNQRGAKQRAPLHYKAALFRVTTAENSVLRAFGPSATTYDDLTRPLNQSATRRNWGGGGLRVGPGPRQVQGCSWREDMTPPIRLPAIVAQAPRWITCVG